MGLEHKNMYSEMRIYHEKLMHEKRVDSNAKMH